MVACSSFVLRAVHSLAATRPGYAIHIPAYMAGHTHSLTAAAACRRATNSGSEAHIHQARPWTRVAWCALRCRP